MAAVASLQSELKSLGSLSKRHNQELSQSSEKSLSILEAATQSFDNDQAIIYSLRKYDDFPTPLILACSEASAKSCASALQCIQTLATHKGIAISRLTELLDALLEATQLGLGIQLKVLQVLPVILFEFAADLNGTQVASLLHVCAELLGSNKVAMVHNAAYATLQQLVSGVFDRVDIADQPGEITLKKLTLDDAETRSFDVSPNLYDASLIWLDICSIVENQKPSFLKVAGFPVASALELFELTLANQAALIHRHTEFAEILRVRVIPLLLRIFGESLEFQVVLRVLRIFYLLLRQHLDILETESEVILSTLAQAFLKNTSWKRAACLEIIEGLFLETDLFLQIYSKFDGKASRLNVLETIATDLAVAVSENSALGLASEMTKDAYDRAVSPNKTNSSNAGSDTSSITSKSSTASDSSNILTKSSAMNVAVIEMLDRTEPPRIKKNYSYMLIMKCINSLADNMHKLASTKLNIKPMMDLLATPILKCFSVTMSIAMELELFRLVVRGVQRMAHAAGIAAEYKLRDEFMSLLMQHCHISEDTISKPWILGRCSLCVRALFSLGYALGNQLEESWGLIGSVIFRLSKQIPRNTDPNPDCMFSNNDPEYRNMSIALKKLVESTPSHSDTAMIYFLNTVRKENDPIQFIILKYTVDVNVARFARSKSACWASLQSIILEKLESSADPTPVIDLLNDVSLTLLQSVVSGGTSTSKVSDNDRSIAMVLHTVCAAIKISSLDFKVMEIEHLNTIIDKFGANIQTGWDDVLEVVSKIPSTNQLDLMYTAFCTLELICSDFLERLPYPCIFSLTICLNEYSRQTSDLNTSFTSTSLFWSVCDHLMATVSKDVDIDAEKINSEEDLVAVARNYKSESKQVALWLFAVTKLASITDTVKQQQVRISALQIFFRLFNTHSPKLPLGIWDIAHRLIFPILLKATEDSVFASPNDMQEFYILVIDGTSRLILLYFSSFDSVSYFKSFWVSWMEFLQNSTPKSPTVCLSAYRNLKILLEAKLPIATQPVAEFWIRQSTLPDFSKTHPKPTADGLKELVSFYKVIRDACDATAALQKLTQCALFPFYTVGTSNGGMSTLQSECTEAFDLVDVCGNPALTSQKLKCFTQLAVSPYMDEDVWSTATDQSAFPKNRNYKGISTWAQKQLMVMLDQLSQDSNGSQLPAEVSSVLSEMHTGMNQISRYESHHLDPVNVVLSILELPQNMDLFDDSEIVESMRLVLTGFNEQSSLETNKTSAYAAEVIKTLEKYITILKGKKFSNSGWNEILRLLLEESVLYERTIHNLKYYESPDANAEAALTYGTIDIPKQLHNKEVSFWCLSMLRRLSCEKKVYTIKAKELLKARARAVLCQYVGDCKVLGQEPLRVMIHEELKFILQEIITCSSEHGLVDESMRKIALKSLSRAHRDILPLLQTILEA